MNFLHETPRLQLRKFVPDDADFVLALLNSPGWLTYIGDRNVRTPEAARAYLGQGPMKSYHDNGFGLLLVQQKSDLRAVGMCGLLRRKDLPHPDLGFALLPEYAGMGYGTEMATAILDSAWKDFGLSIVFAITMPDNQLSIRLLKKTGFTCLEQFSFPGSPESLLLFENRKSAMDPNS